MKTILISLFLFAAGAAVTAGCSSDPCDDLQSNADSCPDPLVKELGSSVAAAKDKDQCRLYRDAWYYTYQPRCNAWGDGGSVDTGTDAAEIADAGGDI